MFMSVPTGGRRGHISVDLGALRPQLDAYCGAHQTTPSAVVRRAVADILAGGMPARDSVVVPYPITPAIEGTDRLVLRLTASEREALSQVAESAGFKTAQRWIIAALRIFLTQKPHLSDNEISVLADSNFQLAAIGRNLNQIAKRLNSEPDVSGYRLDVIEDVNKRIRQHTEFVSSLLQMNIERWKIGGDDGR
ncbi:plasmid mobilization relaxosome protein MobC [Burkholderia ubonensis]|uniref:plasmid mobilization relaxosome protein MobC n=1 Tax=Burkholderia ubonensis TaxID=101571 RepID=UPI002AB2FDD4|nr:plasmid mobilization relaxosome protein MobC [Burkholderia ubonensis]